MSFGRHFTLEDGSPAVQSAWALWEDNGDEALYARVVPESLFHESKEGWVDMVIDDLPTLRPAKLYWTRDGKLYERVIP